MQHLLLMLFNNMRMKTAGTWIAIALTGVALFVFAVSYLIFEDARSVRQTWAEFERGPAQKTDILGELRGALGFGGMIHQYKDFVLHADMDEVATVGRTVDDIYRLIDNYRALGVSKSEAAALGDLRIVVSRYASALQSAARLMRNGASAEAIETQLAVDDAPALAALDVLTMELRAARQTAAGRVYGKIGTLERLALGGSVIVLLVQIMVMLGFLLGNRRWLVAPMEALSGAMLELADGDLAVEVPGTERRDELGEMASTVLVFKQNMVRNRELTEREEANRRARGERGERIERMIGGFDASVSRILATVSSSAGELERTAQSMSATAEQASGQASAVATASDEAATNVQTVAATAEELSASISEIGRQVGESVKIALHAVNEAEDTGQTMSELSEAAGKIGEVITLINEIAGKTNLLALNATIEAARAGEAGKGFAVVAGEVKNLASQTARATEDIGRQIAAIQERTGDAVTAIGRIRAVIDQVNDISLAVASSVEQQGVSTQEIAENVQQAARGTQEVNSNISGVSRAAGETGAAASQVLVSAGELASQAELLRIEIDKFLGGVKAA